MFCLSNIGDYPDINNNNILFDVNKNCINFKNKIKDPAPTLLYYPLNSIQFKCLNKNNFIDKYIKNNKYPLKQ